MAKQLAIRTDPFDYALNLRDAMDRLFDYSLLRPAAFWRGFGDDSLTIDMVETNDSLVIKAVVPGVKPDDINISLAGDVLTIQGEVQEDHEKDENNVHIRERRFGRFSRAVNLPSSVKIEKADAQFENGIVTVTLPKAEDAKPKVITVKAKNRN